MSAADDVILPSDDRAAKLVTVTGWVSRDGLFFGANERTARWSGSTHAVCSACGEVCPKHYTKCQGCRDLDSIAKHEARERRIYVSGMLYSHLRDRFFVDLDELLEYCEYESVNIADLQVVLCEPIRPRYLDDEDFADELPEDGSIADSAPKLWELMQQWNAEIDRMCAAGEGTSWEPSKYALDTKGL